MPVVTERPRRQELQDRLGQGERGGIEQAEDDLEGGVGGRGGGARGAWERGRPLLELIGDKTSYVGPFGSIAKLVHNLASITTRIVLAEALTLGAKAEMDVEALRQALEDGSLGQGNLLTKTIPNVVFKGDCENVGFALDRSLNDIRLALELAEAVDVPLRIGMLAASEVEAAVAEGLGACDSSASMILQGRCPGVELRTTGSTG